MLVTPAEQQQVDRDNQNRDLIERLQELGGATITPAGPTFKDYCLHDLKRRYPYGMPDENAHADAIRDYMHGWAGCLFAHRSQARQQWLLARFKVEIEATGMLAEGWKPDDSWRWW